jgi:hypothetical protein
VAGAGEEVEVKVEVKVEVVDVIEALKTDYIKTVLFILIIIDKEERKSYAQS